MTLSAIVLTHNEERNIEDCLAGLSWVDEILVVDSESADLTISLAKKHGARTISHPFTDFASQRNFAMAQAAGDWVLFIDADERITPELAKEIKHVILNPANGEESPSGSLGPCPQDDSKKKLCVYAIPRKTFFFGRPLRFSDARRDAPVRLFPKAKARWIQPVHEKIETSLPQRELKNLLLHDSTRDLAQYRKKVLSYIPLELETMRGKGLKPCLIDILWRPCAKFLFLYFWKLGILDGIAGFQYAILSAYYYTFQKYRLYWKERKRGASPRS